MAPEGWHVPSYIEWTELTNFLGGEAVAGKKMKSKSGWKVNNNGTNESGFIALPGGYRAYYALFRDIGYSCFWWSTSEYFKDTAWILYLDIADFDVISLKYDKELGLTVRCLKD